MYRKSKFKKSKSENILLKSITYFQLKNIKFHDSNEPIEKYVLKMIGAEKSEKQAYDLIYIKAENEVNTSLFKSNVHNDSLLFINDIHKNKNTTLYWNSLVADTQYSVSIDFFYCGVLFFRKEQVKEHFKIRI